MADYLTIKNFSKFQRYKDRRPPWIKLYRDILDDMEIMSLSAEQFKLLVSLWLMASEFDNALIPREMPVWRLRLSEKEYEDSLAPLLTAGLVQEVCR